MLRAREASGDMRASIDKLRHKLERQVARYREKRQRSKARGHSGASLLPEPRVGFFRRESLHERLAREGGLDERPPHDTTPRWGAAGIHGVPRPRQWDAVATAEAPGLMRDEIEFVGLPDGSLVATTMSTARL